MKKISRGQLDLVGFSI